MAPRSETTIKKSPIKTKVAENTEERELTERSYSITKAKPAVLFEHGMFTCTDIRLKEKDTKMASYGSATQKAKKDENNASSKRGMDEDKENQPPIKENDKQKEGVTINEVIENLERRRRTISTADFDDASTVVDEGKVSRKINKIYLK